MAEPDKLMRVIYKRIDMTESFSCTVSCEDFEFTSPSITFNEILGVLNKALATRPDHRIYFKREEAPYPMVLQRDLEDLIRTDVPKAIEAFTIPVQTIVIGAEKKRPVPRGLRTGFDMLSDAFGDRVYLRCREGIDGVSVEDPITGRWVTAKRTIETPAMIAYNGMVYHLEEPTSEHKWCTIAVSTLLQLEKTRYYLPRGWNPSQSWISHEDLVKMYEDYKKEKAHVSRS